MTGAERRDRIGRRVAVTWVRGAPSNLLEPKGGASNATWSAEIARAAPPVESSKEASPAGHYLPDRSIDRAMTATLEWDRSTFVAETRQATLDSSTEGPTPARVWGDQWLRVSEKVLKGLNHQLTNRIASLEAVVGIFQDGEPFEPEVIAALAQEVSRLNHLLQLYRCMPAEPFAGSEPVRLQDIVPQVLELHGHHADLRGISVEVDADFETLPLLVRPSALLRCLLVLLGSGAGNALRAGSGALRFAYTGDATSVRVTFEAPQPGGQAIFTGEGSLVHAVRSALAHAFAEVGVTVVNTADGERIRYELRLPTLPEARRRERAAAMAL